MIVLLGCLILILGLTLITGCDKEGSEDFARAVEPLAPLLDHVLDRLLVAGNTFNLFPIAR